MKAGYHEISMRDYLRDPCDKPSLSTQIIHTLYTQSAERARLQHPQLGHKVFDTSPRMDQGSAVHALMHGGAKVIPVQQVAKRTGKDAGVMFTPMDWKTQDAQDARDAIREFGNIPVLPKDMDNLLQAANSGTAVLNDIGQGKHEQTMLWESFGVWFRGRADWISDGPVMRPDLGIEAPNGIDVDTKTVEVADAVTWIGRSMIQNCYDIQMAARHLGHKILTGKERQMFWLLVEIEAPYDTCLVECTPEIIVAGMRKIAHAAKIWQRCLQDNHWPRNDRKAVRASLPSWAQWELESRGVE